MQVEEGRLMYEDHGWWAATLLADRTARKSQGMAVPGESETRLGLKAMSSVFVRCFTVIISSRKDADLDVWNLALTRNPRAALTDCTSCTRLRLR